MGSNVDVVVVGSGNAALCAALAASDGGAKVLVLERAPFDDRGGNTSYTGGSFRTVYNGVDDIVALVPDLTEDQLAHTDFGTYTEADFYSDMARVTESRTDPDLCELLVTRSFPTLQWMKEKGVRFVPKYGRQAFKVGEMFTFWGGLTIEVFDGGTGLIDRLTKACLDAGVEIMYGARAVKLVTTDGRVTGVMYRKDGVENEVSSRSVVLGCGGFEANNEWRTRYLGPGWDLAKVRGSRFNTGDGHAMALEIGAMSYGNWSCAHADPYGITAPEFGEREVGDAYQKHSYPFGIMVNANGERFLDEGMDLRNYTYAKFGRQILTQPGQFAYQVFDAKIAPLLRDQYRTVQSRRVTGDTLEQLASRMEGVNAEGFLRTVREFNDAVATDIPFDPNGKDGRCTTGLAINKANWANALDTPPYEAHGVTCGITFTFGGLKITKEGQVVSSEGSPIGGLFACGEIVGGLFYFNYPGGSGLMSGAVFGRIAGTGAAKAVSA